MIGHLTTHRAITSIRAVNVSLHEAQHASSSVSHISAFLQQKDRVSEKAFGSISSNTV